MDNNCCLSTPFYWIPKISSIPTAYNIWKIKPIAHKVIVLFSTTTTERKGICTSMLNPKLGHERE